MEESYLDEEESYLDEEESYLDEEESVSKKHGYELESESDDDESTDYGKRAAVPSTVGVQYASISSTGTNSSTAFTATHHKVDSIVPKRRRVEDSITRRKAARVAAPSLITNMPRQLLSDAFAIVLHHPFGLVGQNLSFYNIEDCIEFSGHGQHRLVVQTGIVNRSGDFDLQDALDFISMGTIARNPSHDESNSVLAVRYFDESLGVTHLWPFDIIGGCMSVHSYRLRPRFKPNKTKTATI
jgi:hypothetical protein